MRIGRPGANWCNILGLGLGFGFGHGSILLAQTATIATGGLALIGTFALSFSLLTFAVGVVEFGGVVVLSRVVSRAGVSKEEVGRYIGACVLIRLCVMFLVCLIFFWVWRADYIPHEAGCMLLGGVPSLLFAAFNLNGFIDARGRSGVSGLLSSLAYIAASVTMLLCMHWSRPAWLFTVGSAYSVGYVIGVCLQIGVARRLGLAFGRPTRHDVMGFVAAGGAYTAAWIPGQLYSRLQLVLIYSALGGDVAGTVGYLRQIVGAASQLVALLQRVEFVALARLLSTGKRVTNRQLVGTQRVSLLAAVGIAVVFGVVLLGLQYFDVVQKFVVMQLPGFAFLGAYLLQIMASALSQVILAANKDALFLIVKLLSLVAGLVCTNGLMFLLYTYSVPLGDAVAALVQILVIVIALRVQTNYADGGDVSRC